MEITKTRLLLVTLFLVALYWVPAFWFADQVRAAVNASYFMLSLMTAMTLLPDVIDVVQTKGTGISWQAVLAKMGIFLLAAAFSAARVWGLIINAQNFPDELLHSPVGAFFTYLMGIGLFGIFYGFSSAGDIKPKLSARGAIVVACLCGVIIGVAISHLPI